MDGRQKLLAELDRYLPLDAREREMTARLRAFVACHAECFSRSLAVGHVTGSAWVVNRTGDSALLTHHRKLSKWLQPGGHADGDSDIRRVAEREAREESGLRDVAPASNGVYDVDVHEIPAHGSEAAHVHYDVRFAFFGDSSEAPICSSESHAVAWIRLGEIERYAIDDSVRRLAAKTTPLLQLRADERRS